MAKDLMYTPYENPACPTPDPGGSTLAGLRGGYDYADMPKETPNMSALGPQINFIDVKDGPARDALVNVEPGVASPAVPTAPMDKK